MINGGTIEPVCRNADACVLHFKPQSRIVFGFPGSDDTQGHRTVLRELDRITHEVEYDLADTARIRTHILRHRVSDFEDKGKVLALCARLDDLQRIVHEGLKVEGDRLELHGLSLEFREVQNVIDDVQQALGRVADR